MSAMKPRVAILRGDDLNPFELQSYTPLLGSYDLFGVGTRREVFDLRPVQIPVVRLREMARGRLGRRLRPDRSGRLRGLEKVLAGCAIVHSAETFLGITEQAVELRARHGFKVVARCAENIPFLHEDRPHLAARKDVTRPAVDVFQALTESARQALVSEGVPEERVVVVPFGVDRSVFRPAERDSSLLGAWEVPDGWSTILYCGRLIREKGLLHLVEALASLPRTILILVGSGPERLRLERAAEAFGVHDRLRFAGTVDYPQMPRLYASCDVFCLPSLQMPYNEEQFGMVLIEAMACGTPVVTTTTGSIPEVVGEAALVVPPYAPEKLAEALARVQADPDLRATLAQSGIQRVADRFDATKVAESLGDMYRKLLA